MTGAALLLAVAGAVGGALCAAADGALLALDPERAAGDERLGPLLRRDRAHRSLSVVRLAAHLTTGAAAAAALRLGERPPLLAVVLGVFVALAIVLAAESGPRAIGDALGAPLLRALAPGVRVVEMLAAPVVLLGARLDSLFRLGVPLPYHDDSARAAPAPFAPGEVGPGGTGEQHGILRGVLSLGDIEVQAVMVPRINVVAVELSTPWSEVVDRVRSAEHARFPVYDATIDHIVGILYAKDLLGPVIDDAPPLGGWARLVRPATFIPEGKTIDAQLRDFKASRSHIAIVVDEYGGTAGLVTIEDILEEIVGEIRDEHDHEELPIEVEEGRRFWVAGRVTLDDLAEVLGHRFEVEDVATVGGLVFNVLGRVPRAGEELTLDGFRIVVERVVRRRIERVYLERQPELMERSA